jgi:alpha-tubulin suppressor-like RCC1 family protein
MGLFLAFAGLACSGPTGLPSEGAERTGAASKALSGTVSERLTGDGGDASAGDAAADGLPDDGFGLTSANLELQVSENACAANLAQDYFEVTNGSSASLPLSNITIKYWINDTSGGTIRPEVLYGGCITTANGTCVHPVQAVTAMATQFAPACGPNANQQANWEIAVSSTDTTPLGVGQTWSNVQTAVNLSNYANFVPGTGTWFSPCGSGQPYRPNVAFAVYDQGNLVDTQGITVPACRTPQFLQVQSYIDQAFYAYSDIVYSFQDFVGQQIDCIDFMAQHSVQALLAQGGTVPVVAPPAPTPSTPVPPPNSDPNVFYNGQLDPLGNPEACPSGAVPKSRPTVAQVEAAGGVAAYQAALASLPHPQNVQATEHDCWLNSFPNNNTLASQPIFSGNYEHAVGILTGGFAGPTSASYSGMQITTSIYPSNVVSGDHNDSQLWVQTGGCENWWNNGPNAIPSPTCPTGNSCPGVITGQQCPTGNSCSGPSCAVQSVETGVLTGNGSPDAKLVVFFTADGYFSTGCFAGVGSNCCANGTSDCWIGAKNAPAAPGTTTLAKHLPPGTTTSLYGTPPPEIELEVLYQSSTPGQGWWVYVWNVGEKQALGYYPSNTFNWSDNTPGQMALGTATYLQVGGEVYDSWPNNAHTDTSMVSDRPAWEGYEYAAYQKNVLYYDSNGNSYSPKLTYLTTGTPPPNGTGIPASEGDLGFPGLCGLQSGGWTDSSGNPGAYSITSELPAGGTNWGTYFYFGGGTLNPNLPFGPVLGGNLPQPIPHPISVGGQGFACAVTPGGGVECWGDNTWGQLGNNSMTSSSVPVPVANLSNVISVSTSNESACALTATGNVFCWGDDSDGELGAGNSANESECVAAPGLVQTPCSLVPLPIADPTGSINGLATAVSMGSGNACALTASGAVWCWGDNEAGQLGSPSADSPDQCGGLVVAHGCSHSPIQVSGLGGSAGSIAVGNFFSCASLVTSGGVMCWGINDFGQLGNNSTTTCNLANTPGMPPIPEPCSATPLAVQGLPAQGPTGMVAFVSADGPATSACAVTVAGGVLCWGNDGFELGNGPTTSAFPAVPVEGLGSGVTSISVGNGTYCAIQTGLTGGLLCWGAGNLGNGTNASASVPTRVTSVPTLTSDAVTVAVGPFNACVWDASGNVACWGDNTGNATTPSSLVPVLASFP